MRIVRYAYPSYRSLGSMPGSFSRSPWAGLDSEINRLFAASVADSADSTTSTNFPVDLYADANHIHVRAELPGVNRDDIQVELTDGTLNITAVRKYPAAEGQVEQSATLTRSFDIPAEVSADQVTATYENGMLNVTLPKREEAKPKKITVAVK